MLQLEMLVLIVVCLVAASPLLFGVGRRQRLVRAVTLSVVLGTVCWAWVTQPDESPSVRYVGRTAEVPADGYVSSATCRKCHPNEYDSWKRSYHRSMTQRATPATVLGDFDGVDLQLRDITYQLHRRGEEYWVKWQGKPLAELGQASGKIDTLNQRIADPNTAADAKVALRRQLVEETERRETLETQLVAYEGRILQTTGSHNQQVYWMRGGVPGELHTLPFAWIVADGRWAPREAVFIRPPGPWGFTPWNNNCIKCHTTHGRPRPDWNGGKVQSEVAELGISCEACHGPGSEHVAVNQSPVRRLTYYADERPDDTIVQPERLAHDRATEICGYCHSVSSFHDPERYWLEGSHYRPGGDVQEVKAINWPRKGQHQDKSDIPLEGSFWPDGVVRLLGREYNGLLDSPCYQRGEMACMSCHSSHSDDPNDQLKPGMRGDKACLQCHDMQEEISAHTHHPAASSGSRCMNCHMSYSVYGLLKIARSHFIESPNAKTTHETGRPNACTQCHLDKSLGWAARSLSAWYGQPAVELSDDEQRISATVLSLLTGDAGQRAVAAACVGWDEAREASGDDWQAGFVSVLLEDPYDAVRYVAFKSLIELPGFEDFEYDFMGSETSRSEARQRAMERRRASPLDVSGRGAALLLDSQGRLVSAELDRLAAQRDDKAITLAE
jgi:predicted CXXCH cytochrome family protein